MGRVAELGSLDLSVVAAMIIPTSIAHAATITPFHGHIDASVPVSVRCRATYGVQSPTGLTRRFSERPMAVLLRAFSNLIVMVSVLSLAQAVAELGR